MNHEWYMQIGVALFFSALALGMVAWFAERGQFEDLDRGARLPLEDGEGTPEALADGLLEPRQRWRQDGRS